MGQAINFIIKNVFLPGFIIGLLLGMTMMWEINANRPISVTNACVGLLAVQKNVDPSLVLIYYNETIKDNQKPRFGGIENGKDKNRSG